MSKVRAVLMIVAAIGFAVWLGHMDGARHRSDQANEAAARR